MTLPQLTLPQFWSVVVAWAVFAALLLWWIKKEFTAPADNTIWFWLVAIAASLIVGLMVAVMLVGAILR